MQAIFPWRVAGKNHLKTEFLALYHLKQEEKHSKLQN